MRALFLISSLALAACATTQPDPLIVPPADGAEAAATCRADKLASVTGQPRSATLATQILAATGARTIRWVEPGTMVTMDFREDRVTVYLDAAGRVERAACT